MHHGNENPVENRAVLKAFKSNIWKLLISWESSTRSNHKMSAELGQYYHQRAKIPVVETLLSIVIFAFLCSQKNMMKKKSCSTGY